MRKFDKLFRIIAIGTVLALLLLALPVSTVLAAEDIDLDPDAAEIGERVDIEGDGFIASYQGTYPDYTDRTDSYVYIYFSPDEAEEGNEIDDEVEVYELVKTDWVDYSGDFDTYFTVPDDLTDGYPDEDVTGGTYYVYVTYQGDDDIVALATFTVIAAEITLSPDTEKVGEEVTITGVDFEESEYIDVEYDGSSIDFDGDSRTDSYGSFTATIVIPESTAGVHTITVTTGNTVAEADFTVEPDITVNPTTGAPGDSAQVRGTGFGRSVDVDVEFDGDNITTGRTDNYGSFDVTFQIPVKNAAIYLIEAEDDDRNAADVNFTIEAAVTLGQETGNVGSQVTLSGVGFTPNALVDITYDNTKVVSVTADASGKFTNATFTVPKSVYGQHTVTASDGANRATKTFTMESTPPPAPQLVYPEDATKAKSKDTFEWQGVTDPSGPVTYSLQIAADANFANIKLQQTGLAGTTYTLTDAEELVSTEKEAPYYWRVQAVDAASNESGWTAPWTFHVGGFDFSGWPMYVLIAIGGIVLLLVGILVGRRLAYY